MSTHLDMEVLYFDTRIQQEKELQSFKDSQKKTKRALVEYVNKHDGVSIRRVNDAITLFKKVKYLDNRQKTIETYKMVLSNMNERYLKNYTVAENDIKTYINNVYMLQDKLAEYRKTKKKEFNKLKNDIKAAGIDLHMLNMSYIKFKESIKHIKEHNISLDDYKELLTEYNYLNEVVDYYISQEYDIIIEGKIKKRDREEECKKIENVYMESMKDMFNIAPKNKDTEAEFIYSILMEMDEI